MIMKSALLLLAAWFAPAADAPRPGGDPFDSCIVREGERIIGMRPYRECLELLPPERIKGTWFVANEESGFLPEGRPLPPVRVIGDGPMPPENETWLAVEWPEMQRLLEAVPEPEGEGDTFRYAVDFIGRRSRYPGRYHDGSTHVIVVDRMLSIRSAGRVRTRVRMGRLDCWLNECAEAIAKMEGRGR